MNDLQKIVGSIRADSRRDPLAREVIASGFWRGQGLFSAVIEAVEAVENAAINYGFNDSESYHNQLKAARLRLFASLKEIEKAVVIATSKTEK